MIPGNCGCVMIVPLITSILQLNRPFICGCLSPVKPHHKTGCNNTLSYGEVFLLEHHAFLCSQDAVPYCAVTCLTSSILDAYSASTPAESRSIHCCPPSRGVRLSSSSSRTHIQLVIDWSFFEVTVAWLCSCWCRKATYWIKVHSECWLSLLQYEVR